MTGSFDLSASGYSPATVLATLAGHIALTISGGTLAGFDLPRMQTAMENPDAAALETVASDAMAGGTTAFDELQFAAVLDHGDLLLETARMKGGSGEANASGDVNLPTHMMDLRIVLRPQRISAGARYCYPPDRPARSSTTDAGTRGTGTLRRRANALTSTRPQHEGRNDRDPGEQQG